ncbi:MAG: Anti-sigma-W factor RsiW [Pelotomaculum sp. PtaB.Bin104]|nr:MAG: Anti-sigma-W factor RsiW [Pelotomaculum sp. PtaB.Bin104]
MNCSKALLYILPYLDGDLSIEDEKALLDHTRVCSACARELALSRKIACTMRDMGQEDIKAPKELCANVMAKVNAGRPVRAGILSRARLAAWRRFAAIAATVMVIAGGTAGVNAGLKLATDGSSPGYRWAPPQVAIDSNGLNLYEANGTSAPQDSSTPPENNIAGSTANPSAETPPVEGGNPDVSTSTMGTPVKSGDNGETDAVAGGNDQVHPAKTTALALMSNEKVVNSTVLKVNADDLAAAKTKASAKAIEQGAVVQVFPEQSNGKNVIFLRITAPSDKAQSIITGLEGLGTLISRQDEKRDITSLYYETLVQYNDLQYRIGAEVDPTMKMQLEAQASSYKQQLDNWDLEANNFIINLWIEK